MIAMAINFRPTDQHRRLAAALLAGVTSLRDDVVAGRPPDAPVRPGIEDMLDGLVEFLTANAATGSVWLQCRSTTTSK
ncbi:hypothetical protein [Antrihabitans cavernicola]|uniref:Uncharacterized protein n=1 Tax=Antrihabitans cavernicola TaxID=2495913 RepID=A0A5A7SL72_9NOCA|nr:hypothetical protein [Spelaeibacter cavernicola]KAA0024981.1 hypothetical protein FOY51_03450 [Spelaeibacter cavernicola]